MSVILNMMEKTKAAAFLLVALAVMDTTMDERALILNNEMEFLMESASHPRGGQASQETVLSGPATGLTPGQMQGVENLEERYFSDEVAVKASAVQPDDEEDEPEDTTDNRGLRVDGTVPRRR